MLTEFESRRPALLAGLRVAASARAALDAAESELAIAARLAGCTWTELGVQLGLSRQGVRKRYRAAVHARAGADDADPFFQRRSRA